MVFAYHAPPSVHPVCIADTASAGDNAKGQNLQRTDRRENGNRIQVQMELDPWADCRQRPQRHAFRWGIFNRRRGCRLGTDLFGWQDGDRNDNECWRSPRIAICGRQKRLHNSLRVRNQCLDHPRFRGLQRQPGWAVPTSVLVF